MKKIYLLITIFIVFFTMRTHSQSSDKGNLSDNWSFNINAGIPMFWGDVESTFSNKTMVRAGWGFFLSKQLNSIFDLRGQFTIGNVAGSQPQYDRYFEANFYDYQINGTLNFSNLIYGENPCRKLNIYGILGIGFIDFRSLLRKISTDAIIAHNGYVSFGAGDEWTTEGFIAGGIGISYRLDSRFDINIENQWHFINTDYFDCKAGGFPYDMISYTSIGITYRFNFRKNPTTFVDCPKGGYVKAKLEEGGKNYYTYEKKEIDTSFCFGNALYKNCINNYNGGVIIISEGGKNNCIDQKIDSLKMFNSSGSTPQNEKLNELENKLRELENRKNNATPANITPANNNDKLNELEYKIKELENQKNNVAPVDVTPTNNNNDKLNELENKIKDLEKKNNNKTTNVSNTNTSVESDDLNLLSVFFDFNKDDIRPSEMRKIEIVAKLMSKDPNMRVVVSGHCDQKGTEHYNEGLSKKRANVVAKMLISKYKISKSRITREYKGKRNPISKEHSINRRVDFIKQ